MPDDDRTGPDMTMPERLPPLAQSPDAQPELDAEGGESGDWHVPGADSPDDVEETYD